MEAKDKFDYEGHIKKIRSALASNKEDEASELILSIPKETKKDFRYTLALCDILIAKKRFEKAHDALTPLRENLSKNSNRVAKNVLNLINLRMCSINCELGKLQEAIFFSKTLLETGDNFEVHFQAGLIFAKVQNHAVSEKHYLKCVEINSASKEALFNLANSLQNQKKIKEAIETYTKCITLDSGYKSALNNRGNCYKDLRRYKLAIADYERALKIDNSYVSSLKNAAGLYELIREFKPSIKHIRNLIQIQPTSFDALFKLITLERQICDWRRGVKSDQELGERIVKLCDAAPDKPVPSPFSILNIKDDLRFQFDVTKNYTRFRQKNIKRKTIERRKINKRSKIRVGYFSADFHNHATMHLMIKMLELHNKKRFYVECFSFGPKILKDEYQKRVINSCEKFHDLNGMTNEAAAKLARKSNLDIAIDLKGYTTDCRPEIMAHGVAPLQINYLGYPGSMAADFLDIILADAIVIPPEHDKHYSERVFRLPNCYQVNDNDRRISRNKSTRKDCGLDEGSFVFCNFNNSYKIGPNEFDAWCKILKACPDAILWLLKTSDIAELNLKKEAEKRKIDKNRLIFAERMQIEEHLRRIQNADLSLDTFNYNSHTTGSDVLWAGVPLLTKMGNSFPSRVGASLVNAVGLGELVCHSIDEYINKAISLYENKNELKKIKDELKKDKKNKPLFNTQEFTDSMEEFFEEILV